MSPGPGRPDIVVTGVGLVTALGHDTGAVWESLLAGRSGVGPLDLAGLATGIDFAARVPDSALPADELRGRTRAEAFARMAARRALQQAGLAPGPSDPERWGVCLAAGSVPDWTRIPRIPSSAGPDGAAGGIDAAELLRRAPRLLEEHEPGRIARSLAQAWGLRGPVATVQAASCSGTQALGEALRLLRLGRASAVLAGASSALSSLALAALERLGVLAPSAPARPFDRRRRGFVLGEGAAVLVLETGDHARSRGVRPLAELAGYGASCDGHRFAAMAPSAEGASQALRRALADAAVEPAEVDHVNLHGTATTQNDAMEARSLLAVLGERARSVPACANKPQVGHALCAAGAIEAAFTVLALHHGAVPPTVGHGEADADCRVSLDPVRARTAPIRVAVSQSFGFGGQNGALVFCRPDGRRPGDRQAVSRQAVVITAIGQSRSDHARRPDESAGPGRELPRRLRRMVGPAGLCALVAARQALEQAGLGSSRAEALARAGVFLGTTGFDVRADAFLPAIAASLDAAGRFDAERFARVGAARLDPFLAVRALPNTALCALAMAFGLHGPNANFVDDGAGPRALTAGIGALRSGEAELVLVGAADDPTLPHRRLRRLRPGHGLAEGEPEATRPSPSGACSAVLVLETLDHARERGAHPLARIELGRSEGAGSGGHRPELGIAGPLFELIETIEESSSEVRELDWLGLVLHPSAGAPSVELRP